MKLIELKKTEMLKEAEEQTIKSVSSFKEEIADNTKHIKFMESSLGQVEKPLFTSTNTEVVQLRKSIETIFKGFPKTTQEKRISEFGFVENKKLLNTVQAEQIGSFNWSVPRQPARESHSVHWRMLSQPPRQTPVPNSSRSLRDFERQRKLNQTVAPDMF